MCKNELRERSINNNINTATSIAILQLTMATPEKPPALRQRFLLAFLPFCLITSLRLRNFRSVMHVLFCGQTEICSKHRRLKPRKCLETKHSTCAGNFHCCQILIGQNVLFTNPFIYHLYICLKQCAK